jgi:ribosome-associated protein
MTDHQHNDEEITPERLAQLAASYAADKKAIDLQVLDLRGVSSYTDFFVICSGNTDRQVKAIHDGIHDELKHGADGRLLPRRTEGDREARWILLDYIDIVVHVQHSEEREFYSLDRLWKDCPIVPFVDRDLVEAEAGAGSAA